MPTRDASSLEVLKHERKERYGRQGVPPWPTIFRCAVLAGHERREIPSVSSCEKVAEDCNRETRPTFCPRGGIGFIGCRNGILYIYIIAVIFEGARYRLRE